MPQRGHARWPSNLAYVGFGLAIPLASIWTSWRFFEFESYVGGRYQSLQVDLTTLVLCASLIASMFVRRLTVAPAENGALFNNARGAFLWLGLLVLVSAASVARSIEPVMTASITAHLLVLLLVFSVVATRGIPPRLAIFATVVVLGVQCAVAIAQVATQSTVVGHLLWGWPRAALAVETGTSIVATAAGERWLRAYGLLVHPNILGGFIVVALSSLIGLSNGRNRWVAFGCTVGIVTLFLTWSRSAWIGMAVAAVVFIAFGGGVPRPTLRQILTLVTSAAIVAIALVGLAGAPLEARLTANSGNERRSIDERIQQVDAAIEFIRQAPLTGLGAGATSLEFARLSETGLPRENVHNVPLLLAVEVGPLGALAWLAIFATVARVGWRRRSARGVVALTAGVLGLGVISLLDHYLWTQPSGRIWVFVLLGLWTFAVRGNSAPVSPGPVPERSASWSGPGKSSPVSNGKLRQTPPRSPTSRDVTATVLGWLRSGGVGVSEVENQTRVWTDDHWEHARWAIQVHGIAPLLCRQFLSCSALGHLPFSLQTYLTEQYGLNGRRVEVLLSQLESLLGAAHQANVSVMPLKGGLLARHYYPDHALRPMADLDVLVRPNDVARLERVLSDLEYELVETTPRHRIFRLSSQERGVISTEGDHPDNPRRVEVHTSASEEIWGLRYDTTRSLWCGSFPGEFGGAPARLPDATSLLEHLLIHLSRDIADGKLRLIRLFDVALVSTHLSAVDWHDLVSRSAFRGQERFLYAPLHLATRYFCQFTPANVLEDLRQATPSRLVYFLDRSDAHVLSFCNEQAIPMSDRLSWHRPGRERRIAWCRVFFPTSERLAHVYPRLGSGKLLLLALVLHLIHLTDWGVRRLLRQPRRAWFNRLAGGHGR